MVVWCGWKVIINSVREIYIERRAWQFDIQLTTGSISKANIINLTPNLMDTWRRHGGKCWSFWSSGWLVNMTSFTIRKVWNPWGIAETIHRWMGCQRRNGEHNHSSNQHRDNPKNKQEHPFVKSLGQRSNHAKDKCSKASRTHCDETHVLNSSLKKTNYGS